MSVESALAEARRCAREVPDGPVHAYMGEDLYWKLVYIMGGRKLDWLRWKWCELKRRVRGVRARWFSKGEEVKT